MKDRTRGVGFLLGAAFTFTLMSTCVKLAGQRLPAMELVLARGVITLVLSFIWLRQTGVPIWGNDKTRLLLRGALGFGGLSCFYTALTLLPLAETTVIHYINPILTAVLAALLLKERVSWVLAVGIALSAAGVLLVGRPGFLFGGGEPLPPLGVAIAVAGAFFSAGAYVTVRRLRKTDHPMVIVFYFPLVAVPLTIPLVWRVFLMPKGIEWLWLIGIGVTTQIAQVLLTHGLAKVPAGRAMAIGYSQIVFATVVGIVIFTEIPPLLTFGGALLIVTGTALAIFSRDDTAPD